MSPRRTPRRISVLPPRWFQVRGAVLCACAKAHHIQAGEWALFWSRRHHVLAIQYVLCEEAAKAKGYFRPPRKVVLRRREADAMQAGYEAGLSKGIVDGYDATFWRGSYKLLSDAVMEHLSAFIRDDDVAEEAIFVDAIEKAGAALATPAWQPITTAPKDGTTPESERTHEGARKCAEVLRACLDIGWRKEDLDFLERMFWTVRDGRGDVKPPQDQ